MTTDIKRLKSEIDAAEEELAQLHSDGDVSDRYLDERQDDIDEMYNRYEKATPILDTL